MVSFFAIPSFSFISGFLFMAGGTVPIIQLPSHRDSAAIEAKVAAICASTPSVTGVV